MSRIEWLVATAVICLLLVCLSGGFPLEVPFYLGFGWVLFVARVVPKVRLDATGAVTALVCVTGLTVGLHWFARWLYAAIREGEPRWRFRWTVTLLALVVLMFAAGTAAVGIAHQTAWLLSKPDQITKATGFYGQAQARMQSANNLKQFGLAAHGHHDATEAFPPGGTFDAHGNALHGWQTALLPYMEQGVLDRAIDRTVPWTHPTNAPHFRKSVESYLATGGGERHDDAGFALSHYAANAHVLNGGAARTVKSLTDGASNTILAGEAWAAYSPWGHPANWRDPTRGIHTTPDSFGSPVNSGGAQFLMADGSVRWVNKTVSAATLIHVPTDGGDF